MSQSAAHAPLTQISPAPQVVPVVTFVQVVVDDAGVHTWQAFAGFTAVDAYVAPAMSQSAAQAPPTQISPAPQLVPVVTFDHALVEVAGVHTWQAFAGFTVVEAYVTPTMSQSAAHAPLTQMTPEPQLAPLVTFDHPVVDDAGVHTWQLFAGFTVVAAYVTPAMSQSAAHAPLTQICPVPQLAPVVTFDHPVVDDAGVHTWQAFAGFTVVAAYVTPAMSQSAAQAPLTQIWPAPQLVPVVTFVQVVVDDAGVHIWQAFAGFTLAAAYVTPPMSQSAAHAPLTQISPAPQLVPVVTFDHAVVDDAGVHTWQAFAGFTVVEEYVTPAMSQSAAQAPLTQISPAPQLVPVVTFDHAVVDDAGVHTWQAFAGFTVVEEYVTPAMSQSAAQAPLTQISPAPQLVPVVTFDHAVVDDAGVHTWQAFAGFTVVEEYVTPPMSQSAAHAPLTQISPAPQLVPVVTFDHAVVDDAGVHTWQAFAGFTVVEEYVTPPISQSAAHAPLTQMTPDPQLAPVATFDQALVDDAGVHTWQAFAGFGVVDVYVTPPMSQSVRHAPVTQISPAPQLVPVATLDHALVELDGLQTWHAFAGFAAPGP